MTNSRGANGSGADNLVKLWKISPPRAPPKPVVISREDEVKDEEELSEDMKIGKSLSLPSGSHSTAQGPVSKCKREFKDAHGSCPIESISLCSDGETFISTDCLKVNMWKLDISNECYSRIRLGRSVYSVKLIAFCRCFGSQTGQDREYHRSYYLGCVPSLRLLVAHI